MKFIWNKQKCEVRVYRTTYSDGALHIYLEDESGRFFLSLSSHIYYSQHIANIFAFVNLSSLSDADRFIVKNKLGKSTGITKIDKRQKYYLYQFDFNNITEKEIQRDYI